MPPSKPHAGDGSRDASTAPEDDATSPALWALFWLFFASGLAGLVYQVLWTRELGLVFGSTTRAASAVLASFFGGMALGNLAGGRLARSRSRALLLYGVAEVAIAAGGLLLLFWLDLYARYYPALYGSALGSGATLRALQLVLAFVAMGPPTVAMGATLPLISRAAVGRASHLGRRVAAVYAANTLGATLGVLLAGFLLPVWLGVRSSLLLAAAVNLAVALATFATWWRVRSRAPARVEHAAETRAGAGDPETRGATTADGARPRMDPALYVVVVASGLGTLMLEVLYVRLIAHTSDSSVYSFALMLAVFLVALAIGSLLASRLVDRIRSPWRLIGWTGSLSAFAILLSPRVFAWASDWGVLSPAGPGGSYLGRLSLFAFVTIGPGVVLIGVALPTCWRIAAREASETGSRIGRLTAANTLAGVVGSLAAGFLVLPVLGLGAGFALSACVFATLAVVAWLRAAPGRSGLRAGALTLSIAAALVALGTWQVLPLTLRGREKIVHYHDGESGTVAVTEDVRGHRQLRINNRYGLATTSPQDVRRQRDEGRLGLLLAREPRSAAFIGVATGISLSAVVDAPRLERVVAMELVPGVLDAAWAFEDANLGVLRDPRLEIVVADARNHLYASGERFDVIVGDLFVPWHAGTGYLYTAEHFAVVADRLEPGGVFVQWLQGSIISLEEVRVIAATFGDAFSETQLWRVRDTAWLAFVGRNEADPVDPLVRAADPRFADFEPIGAGATLRRWTAGALRNTDDFPLIEFSTAATHLASRPHAERKLARAIAQLRRQWLEEREAGGLGGAAKDAPGK